MVAYNKKIVYWDITQWYIIKTKFLHLHVHRHQRAVWLSGNTLAGCATVGGSNLDQCSKICKVQKPGSQHWKTVYLPWLGYHVKPLVPCIGRVIPKHVKDPGTFIEKSRV